MSRSIAPPLAEPLPWWRFPTGWLAFGLPLVAVAAASLSAVIAVRGADPLVDDRRAASHQAADEQAEHGPRAESRQPAEVARNHASMRK